VTPSHEEIPPLPDPRSLRREPNYRPVVMAAVIGGGLSLAIVVVGLVVLGWHAQGSNQVAMTGLAAIGSTLAGGFAAWIGRTAVGTQSTERRRTDEPNGQRR
jgi:hypothetical protein